MSDLRSQLVRPHETTRPMRIVRGQPDPAAAARAEAARRAWLSQPRFTLPEPKPLAQILAENKMSLLALCRAEQAGGYERRAIIATIEKALREARYVEQPDGTWLPAAEVASPSAE